MVSGAEESGRLIRFQAGKLEPITMEGEFARAQVHALAKDTEGRVWVGTSHGLGLLKEDRFERVDSLETVGNEKIKALIACRDGGLWVCDTARVPECRPALKFWARIHTATSVWEGILRDLLRLRAKESFRRLTPGTDFQGRRSLVIWPIAKGTNGWAFSTVDWCACNRGDSASWAALP